ncbi:MAG: hypothetical protein KJO96_01160, partial [Winogradskyella sp.]|nr:hypothetical protein [Winogradskyella sp.]
MKLHLSLALFLFLSISITAQTDGWHLYTKASEITKILPDDVNTDELHLATDIGYIKYNTTSNTVTDFLNLTSQNPAIGNVKDVSLDPTSNNVALSLKDGIAIYDGLAVTVYRYDNSNLTIGESTPQFFNLQVDYAKDGSLYIHKEGTFGYQKFNNGSFEAEMVTSFRPKDVAENSNGTKAYFAGDNNGLWELDKSTDTWTNYTTSNSDLFQNALTSLCFDSADNLYMGNYQGIDKLDTAGTFTSCNDISPIPVFEISINPLNGDLLVRNSQPSSANIFGLSIVDFDSCTWTNYREDDTNCLNKDVYSACSYGGNGLAYVVPPYVSSIADIGSVYEFTVPTESCSEIDINYLNAPVAINANVITDFAIREKANGNLEMGFHRTNDLH